MKPTAFLINIARGMRSTEKRPRARGAEQEMNIPGLLPRSALEVGRTVMRRYAGLPPCVAEWRCGAGPVSARIRRRQRRRERSHRA